MNTHLMHTYSHSFTDDSHRTPGVNIDRRFHPRQDTLTRNWTPQIRLSTINHSLNLT